MHDAKLTAEIVGIVSDQAPRSPRTRVTIAVPTAGYVHAHFALALSIMVKFSSLEIMIAVGRGSNICQNRNVLVQMARQHDSKFLMFIDDDMSFPHFTVDRMVRIAEERGLDVLGCNYLFKAPPHKQMVMPKDEKEQLIQGIDEVDLLPTGMMLIRMSVFDRIDPPWFLYEPAMDSDMHTVGTEDYFFCRSARAKGIKIHMDSDLSFGLVHWAGPFGVKWERGDPHYSYLTEPLSYLPEEVIEKVA
jgi:hypothetical protein